MRVSTVDEMRQLDQRAVSELGVPEPLLMENAANGVYRVIREVYGVADRRFTVVCGTGNNGGDGLASARLLKASGGVPEVLLLGPVDRLGETSRLNYEMASACGVPVHVDGNPDDLPSMLHRAHVVIDAVLGTGISGEVRGRAADVIDMLCAGRRPVVSVDIPSGVNGNTGEICGRAVRAEHTVTFGLPKRGSFLYPGAGQCGELWVTPISFSPELVASAGISVALNLPAALPPRPAHGHKGTFGDVLVVAGAASYYGAPVLASGAVLRAGGGYVRLAAPDVVVPHLAAPGSEIVFQPMPSTQQGSLARSAGERLAELGGSVDFAVVGPGLSLDSETTELVRWLVAHLEAPALLDGDGLSALVGNLGLITDRDQPTVLTPHPGEMARLRGVSVAEVVADPIAAAMGLARDTGAIVVLKGAHSLIASPDGDVRINVTGNCGMGTAGSGDVLTGTIAAMYGLGLDVLEAARAGVLVHGLAGDIAAEELGEDGVVASDILDSLPAAVAVYRSDHAEETADNWGAVHLL